MSSGQQVANQLILILIIVAVFYFFLLRPQIKKQRERSRLIASLKTGDRIMTIGGIFGQVKDVKDDMLMLEVAKDVILEVSKSAIAQKVTLEPK